LNSSKTVADIYNYIDLLKSYEEKLEEPFRKVKEENKGDLLWFESYSRGFDMLWMGTWDILQGSLEMLIGKGVQQEIIDFAKLDRQDVLKKIPMI